MPLINPSSLYTGGKFTVNPLPYMQIAMQQRARKAAQDEAIDKHFQELPNTINDKGVRDQEIEGLNTKKNEIFQFGLQNKEALRNPKIDNGASQLALDKMFRDAQGYAQQSKNRSATATKLSQLRGNPKYDYIFKDPAIIDKIAAHEQPVDAEGSQAINFDQLTLPPAPFDPNKYLSGFKDVKHDYTTTTSPNPQDKFTLIKTETPSLSEDAKKLVYQRASDALVENPSFEDHIKKSMDSDPSLIGQLQKTFKDTYGRDVNPVTADHDLAAAYTLLGMGNAGVKTSTIPNTQAKNDATLNRQMTMEGIRQKDRESFYQYKKSGDEGGANMILNKVVDNMYDSGKINQNVKLGDTEYNGRIVSVPKEISKQYAQEYFDKDNMVKMKKEPDHFVLTNDKKFLIPLFMGAKNENGRSKLITNDNSAPIPIQDLKISLGRLILPKKQQGSEVIDDGSDPDAKSTPEKHTETTITKGSSSKSSKPKKITQNGYTYILNEKSGEYE